MSEPIRLQRKRTKGFKLVSPNGLENVFVGRPSKYGNPYQIGKRYDGLAVNNNKDAVDLFEIMWMDAKPEDILKLQVELKDKNLVCWCDLDKPCHADILLKIANKEVNNHV